MVGGRERSCHTKCSNRPSTHVQLIGKRTDCSPLSRIPRDSRGDTGWRDNVHPRSSRKGSWTVAIYRRIEVRVQVDGCQSRMSQFRMVDADTLEFRSRNHARILSRGNSNAFFRRASSIMNFKLFLGNPGNAWHVSIVNFFASILIHCSTRVTRAFSDNMSFSFLFLFLFFFFFLKAILFYSSNVINGLYTMT